VYCCNTLFSNYCGRYGPWKCKFVFRQTKEIAIVIWRKILAFLSPIAHICCPQCTFQQHVNFICTLNLKVVNFSSKITRFVFYLVLWTEFITRQSTDLEKIWLDLFCNCYLTQCICNHSTAVVVIFIVIISHCTCSHFWQIQNFIVNLDTMSINEYYNCMFVLWKLNILHMIRSPYKLS
jgi:hypothetical protein